MITMHEAKRTTGENKLKRLTKQEIDRRVEGLLVEAGLRLVGTDEATVESLRPRAISAAEFVRRMKRFLVYN